MQNVLTQNQIYKYRYAHGFFILNVFSVLTEIHIQKYPFFPDFRASDLGTQRTATDSRLACAHARMCMRKTGLPFGADVFFHIARAMYLVAS